MVDLNLLTVVTFFETKLALPTISFVNAIQNGEFVVLPKVDMRWKLEFEFWSFDQGIDKNKWFIHLLGLVAKNNLQNILPKLVSKEIVDCFLWCFYCVQHVKLESFHGNTKMDWIKWILSSQPKILQTTSEMFSQTTFVELNFVARTLWKEARIELITLSVNTEVKCHLYVFISNENEALFGSLNTFGKDSKIYIYFPNVTMTNLTCIQKKMYESIIGEESIYKKIYTTIRTDLEAIKLPTIDAYIKNLIQHLVNTLRGGDKTNISISKAYMNERTKYYKSKLDKFKWFRDENCNFQRQFHHKDLITFDHIFDRSSSIDVPIGNIEGIISGQMGEIMTSSQFMTSPSGIYRHAEQKGLYFKCNNNNNSTDTDSDIISGFDILLDHELTVPMNVYQYESSGRFSVDGVIVSIPAIIELLTFLLDHWHRIGLTKEDLSLLTQPNLQLIVVAVILYNIPGVENYDIISLLDDGVVVKRRQEREALFYQSESNLVYMLKEIKNDTFIDLIPIVQKALEMKKRMTSLKDVISTFPETEATMGRVKMIKLFCFTSTWKSIKRIKNDKQIKIQYKIDERINFKNIDAWFNRVKVNFLWTSNTDYECMLIDQYILDYPYEYKPKHIIIRRPAIPCTKYLLDFYMYKENILESDSIWILCSLTYPLESLLAKFHNHHKDINNVRLLLIGMALEVDEIVLYSMNNNDDDERNVLVCYPLDKSLMEMILYFSCWIILFQQ